MTFGRLLDGGLDLEGDCRAHRGGTARQRPEERSTQDNAEPACVIARSPCSQVAVGFAGLVCVWEDEAVVHDQGPENDTIVEYECWQDTRTADDDQGMMGAGRKGHWTAALGPRQGRSVQAVEAVLWGGMFISGWAGPACNSAVRRASSSPVSGGRLARHFSWVQEGSS